MSEREKKKKKQESSEMDKNQSSVGGGGRGLIEKKVPGFDDGETDRLRGQRFVSRLLLQSLNQVIGTKDELNLCVLYQSFCLIAERERKGGGMLT